MLPGSLLQTKWWGTVYVQEARAHVPPTSKIPGSQNPMRSLKELLQLMKTLIAAPAECEFLRSQLQVRNTQAIPPEPDQASSTEKRPLTLSIKEDFGSATRLVLTQQTNPQS